MGRIGPSQTLKIAAKPEIFQAQRFYGIKVRIKKPLVVQGAESSHPSQVSIKPVDAIPQGNAGT